MAFSGKACAKRAGGFLAVAAIAFGGYIAYLQLSGNFHEVIAGQFYRSGQPSAAQLDRYIKDHGIRTVINLRGENLDAPWYQQELAQSQSLGITHIDFGMSAGKALTMPQTEQLIALLRDAPKPILVHCQGGADRSGLVSVIYMQQVAHIDEDVAEEQLSPLYGHVALPFLSRSYAMDDSWETLEKLLGIST